ncbi:E3 ubiquitin-protein ligase SIAH1 [Orchesella cincta]|uniref:E3 ubiquitin-protein ligase SIAH1 n=1 Tax=Orchesella cincta TaxID=48709 RepID=A0A1D2MI79_ORCCI|nr:E3 ubiquitin-protein ligase SIAH1 [Orchesella cincta]
MEEHQKCPICFEIPAQEIYQCASGHTVCGSCSTNLELCPQCRDPYGSKKIRNRALEQILDAQTFDCIHKDKGCKEKLKRQEISNHADVCPFDKKSIRFCQKIGFEDCDHSLDPGNLSIIAKHFEECHGAASERSSQVIVWHTDFSSTIKANKNSKWSPVLLSPDKIGSNNSLFMILGRVDVRRESASWGCLQICGSGDKPSDTYEAEFGFLNSASETKVPPFRWIMPVINALEDDIDCIKYSPIEVPLVFLSGLCLSIEDIPVSVFIQAKNKSGERPTQKLPEVWTFSSQVDYKAIAQSAVNTAVSHNACCDECSENPILGKRYKCLQCVDFDLCDICMQAGTHAHHIFAVVGTAQQSRLFRESFTRIRVTNNENTPVRPTRNRATIFHGIGCDGCEKKPIVGKQYKCLQCDDYDLCDECMEGGNHSLHIFAVLTTQQERERLMRSFDQIRF